jgi:hypothetical protein
MRAIPLFYPLTLLREGLMSQVDFIVEVLPEEAPVRGNAFASGNDDIDRRVEDAILADIADGIVGQNQRNLSCNRFTNLWS